MSSVPTYMTTKQFAAYRGVSDSYVRRLRREQRLVEDPRLGIDVAASVALLDATQDPVRGGDRTGKQPAGARVGAPESDESRADPHAPVGLREAMRRERVAKARREELALGEETKQLTRTRDVDRAVFTLARQALERLRTMASRLRTALAAESDPRACEELLDKEVRRICEDLQKGAQAVTSPSPDNAAGVAQ